MTGRPDEGYQVAARIEARSSRRGQLLAVLAAALVLTWVGVTLADRVSGDSPGRSGDAGPPGSGLVAGGSVEPTSSPGGPLPAYPPAVEIFRPTAPLGRLPVVLGGLGWLDPANGTFDRALGLGLGQWP